MRKSWKNTVIIVRGDSHFCSKELMDWCAGKQNIRVIVTDLWEYRTRALYEQGYCGRGRMELNIKDHKTYLLSRRMSCTRFYANQFRLFLHSAAYVLGYNLQEKMLKTKGLSSVTMKTLRERFIKIAAQVRELKTKIKVEFPASCPHAELMESYFLEIGKLRI